MFPFSDTVLKGFSIFILLEKHSISFEMSTLYTIRPEQHFMNMKEMLDFPISLIATYL